MRARCPCNKPPADPHCPRCGGEGFFEAQLPEPEALEAFWIGRCPECGSENGGCIQRSGTPSPRENPHEQANLPPCFNQLCPSETVQWVDADQIIEEWIALCPLCSERHWVSYLQITPEDTPAGAAHSLTCPVHACSHTPMNWVRVSELHEG